MPKEEGFVQTHDGIRLYYQTIGTGNEIVIPNGFYYVNDFERFAESHKLIIYDVRNRGNSGCMSDPEKMKNVFNNDVGDLEELRAHFNLPSMTLAGHSYIGVMIASYAQKYPQKIKKLVLISSSPPDSSIQSPPDNVTAEVFSAIGEFQKSAPADPGERCRKFWSLLRKIYVYDPANADKIDWGRCELQNERNAFQYYGNYILPSLQTLRLTRESLANVTAPVLIVHGDKDRSAPYAGALEWQKLLPNARLVTIHDAAHAPWIESPENFYPALESFLREK